MKKVAVVEKERDATFKPFPREFFNSDRSTCSAFYLFIRFRLRESFGCGDKSDFESTIKPLLGGVGTGACSIWSERESHFFLSPLLLSATKVNNPSKLDVGVQVIETNRSYPSTTSNSYFE
ncbi:hypothetical protein X975_10261, partial [Stegodyphus mimosarum]